MKLKSCPFCGGEAYTTYEDCYGIYHNDYFVCCDKCGLQFGFTNQFESEEQAIEAWNRRKPLEDIVEQLIANSGIVEDGDGHAGHVIFTKTAIEIVKSGGKV